MVIYIYIVIWDIVIAYIYGISNQMIHILLIYALWIKYIPQIPSSPVAYPSSGPRHPDRRWTARARAPCNAFARSLASTQSNEKHGLMTMFKDV